MLLDKVFENLTPRGLQTLVDEGIPEGRQLEYKRDHYGRTPEAKREFAADVSAMANALGGYLLIGVDEENGRASEIVGIEAENPDALVRAVSDSIRTSIDPPVADVGIRWIEIANPKGVLVIRIGRSWAAPHRVTVAKDSRFFVRDENGKHPMSVDELRRAFLFASEVEERIRNFRKDRLEILIANEGPLAVKEDGPRVIMQVVPQAAFTERTQIAFDSCSTGIAPLGARGWNWMYSIDGLVSYSEREEGFESVRAFSTLFRNGIAEAVGRIRTWKQSELHFIELTGIEHEIIGEVENILSVYRTLAVPAPYYVMLSLVGVRCLSAPVDQRRLSLAFPHRSDQVLLPELVIDEVTAKANPASFLKSVFDLMWNAFGQPGSPSYDSSGQYRT